MIHQENTKKLATCLIIFLFCLSILSREKTNNNDDMLFVRSTAETMTHNAANTQRDYLFENEKNTNQTKDITGTTSPDAHTWTNQETIYSGSLLPSVVPTITSGSITHILTTTGQQKNCITPRKEEVKDKNFVLAYQQRTDVATICNVEKRVCTNGVLDWTYVQKECDEHITYNYHKAEVISYNQKVLNEYIQPTTSPNAGATFTTNGKIDPQDTTTTTRENNTSTISTNQTGQEQTQTHKQNCTTPRGQSIRHGQFIKAYKNPRGFIDIACKVELRPCIDGELRWSFQYAQCTFTNTTYDQYLQKKSPFEGTGFLFFKRIQSTLKRWK